MLTSVPDSGSDDTRFCVGSECRCEHRPVGQASWCCDACRERHRAPRTRVRTDQRQRPNRVRSQPERRFVGIDGESVDNRYVLLAAADDQGWSTYIEPRRGEAEIRTTDALRFVATLPKAIVWGFAFNYDVNMMLGDCRPVIIRRLYETTRVRIGRFRIEYIPSKMFRVTLYDRIGQDAKRISTGTVWDMFPWQTSSFAAWLEREQLAEPDEIERIRTMKHKRASFDAKHRRQIIDYCLSECTYLARGAHRLVDTIEAGGFRTRGMYHSPASLSKAQMTTNGVREHMTEPPKELAGKFDRAYFGGRAEVAQSGPVEGPLWQHDIRSAYPTEIAALPCLACGRWVHDDTEGYRLQRVAWSPPDGRRHMKWGPFPMRGEVGSLRFPSHGRGWYWGIEVDAARRIADIAVHDTWTFIPGCDHRPFAYIPEMYAHRQQLKSAGDPIEYVMKLALNATYGALAERPSRGQRTPPKWRNLMWAGLVTAGTRARMLGLIDDSVVMIATDGIFATKPLGVVEGTALGEWDTEQYSAMWIAGTGFYFRQQDGEWLAPKTRGFSAADVNRDRLIDVWATEGREGKLTDMRRQFIGMGTALHRIGGIWPPFERLWRQFIDAPVTKTFDLYPRREWLTDDIYDGRSRAPSLALHRRTLQADMAALVEKRRWIEKRSARMRKTIAFAEKRGIPLDPSPVFQRNMRQLLARVVEAEGLEAALLNRADNPMGEMDV